MYHVHIARQQLQLVGKLQDPCGSVLVRRKDEVQCPLPFPQRKKIIAGSVGASWVMFFIPHHTNQNEKLNSIKHVQMYNKSERRRRKTCHDVNQRQASDRTPGAHSQTPSEGARRPLMIDLPWQAASGHPWKKPNSSWKRWQCKMSWTATWQWSQWHSHCHEHIYTQNLGKPDMALSPM